MTHANREEATGRYLAVLSLAALGVVYGDIGTSPLYAVRESFEFYDLAPTPPNVLGVLSLIFWSLIIVISIKYLAFVLRADNRGEGGMIALTALVAPRQTTTQGRRMILVLLGLFGASLLYGDSMITPAITVLSAVEGLRVATPLFEPYVIPIAIVILVGLFAVQSRGTAGVGKVFGPITLVWFLVLAALGVSQIARNPSVLWAVNPAHAAGFFARNGWHGFLVLGSVFLVVTGGEALYADMGHFGRWPIRLTWFAVVLPALVLNYFGQGALLLREPEAVENPFFHMAPEWALYPLVAIATAAAVIASQAVISGAFSLTRQAVQLGYLPRLDIEHTSAREMGQIYVPAVNWALMLACIGLVLGFRNSSSLAAAYGVAVTTDMVFTTVLFVVVARARWGWSPLALGALAAFFLTVDLSFWGANIVKIPHGGWFPLVVAGVMFSLMTTWKKGRQILAGRLHANTLPFEFFLRDVEDHPPVRVPGTAVFMYGRADGTPPALLHNLVHNKVLHEQVVLLAVETLEIPAVPEEERVEVIPLGTGFYRVVVRYGFTEDPDIPAVLSRVREPGLNLRPMETSYFLGRETLIPSKRPGMAFWREHLFSVMSRNARPATSFFQLPPNRVVELGAQIEL
ncbi:MAG TPA: potassium transporter Kup [Longimicrobiaceae bacterium]|nr:potassium transporter Kup [Longimicrobiaceae bacterium]